MDHIVSSKGVSVIICCHNSSNRLPATLHHLIEQVDVRRIAWEVIIIDNASTDGAGNLAPKLWKADAPAPLKVIHEPRLGLTYSRLRGFKEAQYEYVSFVDDDNWVAPDWVRTVYEVMKEHPEAGACGGKIEAVCEVEPPWWFENYQYMYAVGEQAQQSGDITWSRGYFWGAGINVRKIAWDDLVSNGFHPLLSGRKGTQLTAGEDSEICLALRLAGWKLWYGSELRLIHYLPLSRLRWEYLRNLARGFGSSSIGLDPYHMALTEDFKKLKGRTGNIWLGKFCSVVEQLMKDKRKWLPSKICLSEGDDRVLEMEYLIGSFYEILRKRSDFNRDVYTVWNAKWNKVRPRRKAEYALSNPG